MGLFSFIKSVGERIKDRDKAHDDATHQQPSATKPVDEMPSSDDLKKSLDKLQLGTDNVQIKVDEGGKVILTGMVKDQATLEKTILAVGNYQGIEQVDTDNLKAASGEEKEPVFYTVKKGDTLSKIAEEQYGKGNANKYNLIFEANKPMLSSPDKIYPGQSLRIPPLS